MFYFNSTLFILNNCKDIFLYFIFVFFTGHALKCYMCNSEKQDGCIKHMSPKEQPCGNPGDGTQFVCYYRTAYGEFDHRKKFKHKFLFVKKLVEVENSVLRNQFKVMRKCTRLSIYDINYIRYNNEK